jgi:hypothetical protein
MDSTSGSISVSNEEMLTTMLRSGPADRTHTQLVVGVPRCGDWVTNGTASNSVHTVTAVARHRSLAQRRAPDAKATARTRLAAGIAGCRWTIEAWRCVAVGTRSGTTHAKTTRRTRRPVWGDSAAATREARYGRAARTRQTAVCTELTSGAAVVPHPTEPGPRKCAVRPPQHMHVPACGHDGARLNPPTQARELRCCRRETIVHTQDILCARLKHREVQDHNAVVTAVQYPRTVFKCTVRIPKRQGADAVGHNRVRHCAVEHLCAPKSTRRAVHTRSRTTDAPPTRRTRHAHNSGGCGTTTVPTRCRAICAACSTANTVPTRGTRCPVRRVRADAAAVAGGRRADATRRGVDCVLPFWAR